MNQDTDGFAALGAMLASTMVDKMIDGFVTPEGMTLMLQGKDLKQSAQQSMGWARFIKPRKEKNLSQNMKRAIPQ